MTCIIRRPPWLSPGLIGVGVTSLGTAGAAEKGQSEKLLRSE